MHNGQTKKDWGYIGDEAREIYGYDDNRNIEEILNHFQGSVLSSLSEDDKEQAGNARSSGKK